MANYAKRDARKERLADLAAHSDERLSGTVLPTCYCGSPATLEVSLSTGTRYFCASHEAEGQRLFEQQKTPRAFLRRGSGGVRK